MQSTTSRTIQETDKPSIVTINYHDRPVTKLLFNRDGDLLFSGAKDTKICLIRQEGEIVGIYRGHAGAIVSLDVNLTSERLATSGADRKVLTWDVANGKETSRYSFNSVVRSIQHFKSNENLLLYCSDNSFNSTPQIGVIDNRSNSIAHTLPLKFATTDAISNFSDTAVVVSDDQGFVHKLDPRNMKEVLLSSKTHTAKINSLKNSFCSSFFITASSDSLAKILSYDLKEIRSFPSEDPVRSAAIFRSNDKVVLGGGLSARDVTLTRSKNFVVSFYETSTGDNIGSYSTHFGTINAVDVHQSGEKYASGGEDGIVCIVSVGDTLDS